jgi:hypothetical protein
MAQWLDAKWFGLTSSNTLFHLLSLLSAARPCNVGMAGLGLIRLFVFPSFPSRQSRAARESAVSAESLELP